LIAGRAPILDFDGTLAHLGVDWEDLRRRLGVRRVADLWQSGHGEVAWADVTAAEVDAAATADPVRPVLSMVEKAGELAILSGSSAHAVAVFLERFPHLRERVAIVVGREDLRGPKTDFQVFKRGFEACLRAMRQPVSPVYFGDQAYELEFATRLGAEAIDVKTLTARDG
jgi:phosphoglycolate phosphatase-like HAD superfamily hydrolase